MIGADLREQILARFNTQPQKGFTITEELLLEIAVQLAGANELKKKEWNRQKPLFGGHQ